MNDQIPHNPQYEEAFAPIDLINMSIEQINNRIIELDNQMKKEPLNEGYYLQLFYYKAEYTIHLEFRLLNNNEK